MRSRTLGLALCTVLIGALLLEACADDAPTAPRDAPPPMAAGTGIAADGARIVIRPHWLTLDTIGATGTLSAVAIDAAGDTVDAAGVEWASLDSAIATVSERGSVTAVAFGTTRVTASWQAATAEATVEVAAPLTDREILEIFYEATGGDEWADNTNWLSDASLWQWHGVSIDENGRVTRLDLYRNDLTGAIPAEIGGLERLDLLRTSYNSISGPIPAELGKLTRLGRLELNNNELEGSLPPEMGGMQTLDYLDVAHNDDIAGTVPHTFAGLELSTFYSNKTDLCVPPSLKPWFDGIPETDNPTPCTARIAFDPPSLYFENLGDTATLSATAVSAEGDTLHDAAVTWSSADPAVATVDSMGLARAVGYGRTEIHGTSGTLGATVDVEVVLTLTDREVLDSIFGLTGGENWTNAVNWRTDRPLSEWFGVETNEAGKVTGLALADNNLTGAIPGLAAELGDLVVLDLSHNNLAGEIPSRLGELRQLRELALNDNALAGRLPPALGRLAALRVLDIGANRLAGPLPSSFSRLALEALYTAGSGACIPPSLDRWFAGIAQTDEAARCIASIAIEVVDLPSPTLFAIGETLHLSATHVSAEGDTTAAAGVTWSSGDPSVASVDGGGRVTAAAPGTTRVRASFRSVADSLEVIVKLPETDRDALEVLYERAGGEGWTNDANWLTDAPLSGWHGVETDGAGRVASLRLPGNNLRGRLHASIGLLDQLVALDLRRKRIAGSIPSEVGDLRQLRELSLAVNGLVGDLPRSLGGLRGLRVLNVAATSLSGLVPASFGGLGLESFLLNGTGLCVPPALAAWLDSVAKTDDPSLCLGRVSVEPRSLTFDAAGDTIRLAASVTGPNGGAVAQPTLRWTSADSGVARVDGRGLVTARAAGVTTVTAAYDSVTAGTVEVAVRLPGSDRAALEALYHATGGDDWRENANWLTDAPLGEWHGIQVFENGRVRYLELPDNNLTGRIPAAVGLLDSLFSFNLRGNSLTGPIPSSIGRLTRVRDLQLRDNRQLGGPLPPEMSNMAALDYVELSNTALSGPFPETFAGLAVGRFYHSGTNLCVPRSLWPWYARFGNDDPLPCIPRTADRDVLVTLYNKTGGPEWHDRENWLTDRSLNTWKGIATDEEGYVTEVFMAWNNMTNSIPPELGNLARLEVLELYGNELTGRIPPELGKLTKVSTLALSSNKLEGPIPPEIGGMVSVDIMYLSGNDLTGPIPPEFGNLVNLTHLALFENELSGPLPAEFGKLKKLKSMLMVDNSFEGPLPPELGEMTALEDISLSRNEITGPIPPELGKLQKLKELGLGDNELTGPIPPELGNMTSLEGMFLMRNRLSGSIPPELGNLSKLEWLWLFNNELTGRIPAELGNLSSLVNMSIGTNELTGSIPPELGNLSALEDLLIPRARLTGPIPPELGNLEKLEALWLFTNQLTGSIPAELGNLSALKDLTVSDNMLSGPIPPELGRLSSLETLSARSNNLSGPMPAELGQLVSLIDLALQSNDLAGRLPPELGDLANLESFNVNNNMDLVGLIPRTMVGLPLGYLDVTSTNLCPHLDDEFQDWLNGIPRAYGLECPATLTERLALSEFYAAAGGDSWTHNGGWTNDAPASRLHGVTVNAADSLVRRLALPHNGLRGTIAPTIANLRKLETLDIADNNLTGGIPVAVASMDALDTLRVSGNAGMEGPLPFRMAGMTGLRALQYQGTGLCAPPSVTFQSWFRGLERTDGAVCDNAAEVRLSLPVVYLTQAIQRPAGDVPLLSGREALLRVFLVGDRANAFYEPEVVATLVRDGREVHRVAMQTEDGRLATVANEGELHASYNALIPAEQILPGTGLVVVADPGETIPRAPGSRARYPETGAAALNVIDVPPLKLTVVPVLNAARPDSSILAWTDGIDADSPQVALFRHSFPFAEFTARTRRPHVTSLDLTDEDNTWSMVLEMEEVYHAEDGTGYWYAVADSEEGYVRGIARLNGWVSFGKPWDTELAHEVGHTLDLEHAPCGGALGVDPAFPYKNGSIGVWGYDFTDGTLVSPELRRDIMGYCYEKGWLSDYYFEKVIRVREEKEGRAQQALMAAAAAPKAEMLALAGGVLNGQPRLEPVHSLFARPKLPAEPGPYRVEGFGADGETAFTLSFTPGEDEYGNKAFFFAIPIEDAWRDSLERITLTGPEGQATADADDRRSVTIVTDPTTGRIHAVLRDWNRAIPPSMGDVGRLEIETTTGIREAVRRR